MVKIPRAFTCALLLLLFAAGTASASTGGPQLTQLLGWDPSESRVYFQVVYVDESGQAPDVYYFDLDHEFSRPERVSWSGSHPADSLYDARVEALRQRLQPLQEQHLLPTIPLQRTVLEVDTLRNASGPWPRFRIQVRDLEILGNAILEVTTIGDPFVSVIRQWTIPGRHERVIVVSFRGLPYELGYEVQAPVLLRADGRSPIVVEIPKREPTTVPGDSSN